jgi:hypothetical protein
MLAAVRFDNKPMLKTDKVNDVEIVDDFLTSPTLAQSPVP